MELAKYKACICEGSAEEAIIDILVDTDFQQRRNVGRTCYPLQKC